jgi:hypothetical protein
MAERAREIGGTLAVQRARQGGIRIQVGVPLPIGGEPRAVVSTPGPGEPSEPGGTAGEVDGETGDRPPETEHGETDPRSTT